MPKENIHYTSEILASLKRTAPIGSVITAIAGHSTEGNANITVTGYDPEQRLILGDNELGERVACEPALINSGCATVNHPSKSA